MRNLLLITFAALLLVGCRTKKSTLDKEQERVSFLKQNDVVISEKEKIQSSTVILNNSKSWSISPVDSQKATNVVYKGDTLSFLNAKLVVNATNNQETTTTNTEKEKEVEDKSFTESESSSSSKKKTKNVKSSSWGLNLGIIFGIVTLVAILLFKNKLRNVL